MADLRIIMHKRISMVITRKSGHRCAHIILASLELAVSIVSLVSLTSLVSIVSLVSLTSLVSIVPDNYLTNFVRYNRLSLIIIDIIDYH